MWMVGVETGLDSTGGLPVGPGLAVGAGGGSGVCCNGGDGLCGAGACFAGEGAGAAGTVLGDVATVPTGVPTPATTIEGAVVVAAVAEVLGESSRDARETGGGTAAPPRIVEEG